MTTPKQALRPFAACVFNDNGDVTIGTSHLRTEDYMRAKSALASLQGEDAVERVARIMVRTDPNYCTYHMPGDTPRDWKATSGYRGKTSELSEFAAEVVRVRARAIIATGLVPDEAAIRADQREIDANILDSRAAAILANASGFRSGGILSTIVSANAGLVMEDAAAIRSGSAK